MGELHQEAEVGTPTSSLAKLSELSATQRELRGLRDDLVRAGITHENEAKLEGQSDRDVGSASKIEDNIDEVPVVESSSALADIAGEGYNANLIHGDIDTKIEAANESSTAN